MRVLLVYEEVPETTRFFVLDNPDARELTALSEAHGGLINSTNNTARQEAAGMLLNAALTARKYVDDKEAWANSFEFTDDIEYWLSRWSDKEITMEDVVNAGEFDKVFHSGFLL